MNKFLGNMLANYQVRNMRVIIRAFHVVISRAFVYSNQLNEKKPYS